MTAFTVAAVQAAYVLMDREATDRVGGAGRGGRRGTAPSWWSSPRRSSPATPIWIDSRPIWDGDDDVVRPPRRPGRRRAGPGDRRARRGGPRAPACTLVIGVNEREPHGTTIYNTMLYFGPDGTLLGKHRKLMPTGAERTVWGMGDGSTLPVVDTPFGRLGGLICWENYMPLARFHLYAQGVDIWLAPTLARGDGWVATMRHIAREGRLLRRRRQSVRARRTRSRPTSRTASGCRAESTEGSDWVEPGNTRHHRPDGQILAGPARERGDHPHRRDRPRRRPRGAPLVRPGRPLQPARHLPAGRRHPAATRQSRRWRPTRTRLSGGSHADRGHGRDG